MSNRSTFLHRNFLNLLTFSFLFLFISFSKANELEALLQFKATLQKSNSNAFDTWTKEYAICNFTGIVCDSNQNVKEINLVGQNLSGTVSFDSICSLESLQKLSLGSNLLFGRISDHLSNCTSLQYLDLGFNSFSGEVPDFSSLSQLKFLNLNGSGFSGLFPWKSLENLTGLTSLSLGDNLFDESQFPLEVLKLEKLQWLYLTNCSIEGKIPEGIGNLTLLENLELSYNNLFGRIPDGITKLTKLYQLELYSNGLTGKIPEGFRNLTSLAYFDVSSNKLEGDISELKFLTQLKSLQLFENQFSGEIPVEFGDFRFLEELSLYTNRFTGPLPVKIGSWAEFKYVDVSENFLTGPIPPDMCKQGKLEELLVLQNKFSGLIPENYVNCSSLIRLRMNNNSLSGIVPRGIWSLPSLSIIDLTFNQFEGPVTLNIGEAKSLAQLYLANNKFSGELPDTISEASSLVAINLSSNQFRGNLPAKLGELQKLSSLHCEYNLFSGIIPDSIGSCVSLNEVNLASNSFTGEIPASLGSLPSLNSLNLSDNKLSGEIPARLSSLKLSLLDLSNNRLVGHIPDSLAISVFNSSFDGNLGLCSDNIRNFRQCSPISGTSRGSRTFIFCFTAGASIIILSLACFIYMKFRYNNQDTSMNRPDSWDMKHYRALSFSEEEILRELKTENLIGKGGSGNVYKVVLHNGKQLAVKHIWKSAYGDGMSFRSGSSILPKGKRYSPEYEAEVTTLSSVRHVNVVKLYCSIMSEDSYLLIYEFLPNGSLWDRLHGSQKIKMDWMVRYQIALGAARGLEYLHHGYDRPVIHRDVKSSNILLDEQMKPRIADFGLARILQVDAARDSTNVIAGTLGYIAPEYAYTSKVNEKSDVYSFGVVLMELVSGKRPVEPEFGENNDIVQWVFSTMRNKDNTVNIVDSSISEALREDAAQVMRIAIHCTARLPALRPNMRMVVQMLEEVEPCKLTGIVVDIETDKGKNQGHVQ
ncbi:Leucine-rich receptor-like protein kinase family protein [Forsythia ovata]|uniref:Leucine-rich receptor-like protein kinase family protein n=1 Tax=Forsythia ovata TaxID=205694 RepID=A0ABD1TLF6_9LAMI